MGRTLFGIDLDESPVGGLIEDLLTEEDLEKLADGGRPAGEPSAGDDPDDGDDRSPRDDATGAGGGSTDRRRGARRGQDTPSPGADAVNEPLTDLRDEADEEESGGILSKLRPHLKKIVAGLVLLAVLGVVAWKYMGRAKDAASDKVGGDDSAPDPAEGHVEGDVPEARARAKAAEGDWAWRDDEGDETDRDADERRDAGRQRAGTTSGRLPDDSDTGALVGLAALALMAALVRKFGEQRPRDPLVEGEE